MKKLLIFLGIIVIGACTPYRYLDRHHAEICNDCLDEYVRNNPGKDSIITNIDTCWQDVSENLIDSTYTELYFQCDSNNQVLLKRLVKVKDSDKIISSYIFQNNILQVSNKAYQDSIMQLNKTITVLKKNTQVIEKPPITIYKTPVWVYFVGGFVVLFMIILLIIVIKK